MFVIRPKILLPEADIEGGDHVLHAVFNESCNGINFKCFNSWGTEFEEILIPVDQTDPPKEIEIVE